MNCRCGKEYIPEDSIICPNCGQVLTNVCRNGKYGLIGTKGDVIIPCVYAFTGQLPCRWSIFYYIYILERNY